MTAKKVSETLRTVNKNIVPQVLILFLHKINITKDQNR